MNNACLVLEGGGNRGMYTSGVLDAFMDNNIFINNIYGVSAGAYNALSYLSRQRGRTYRINSIYLKDKRYINIKRAFFNKSAINTDFIFGEVFKELDPFDYKEFKKNAKGFYAVSTNCLDGKPVYAQIRDLEKDVEYVKASAALPLFADLVKVDDLVLSDGGMSDSIPLKQAIKDGNKKCILILTQPKDFIKKESKLMKLYRIRYKEYPDFIKTIEERPEKYNETLEYINELEELGKIIVIRPSESLNIDNLEKDKEKIKNIYQKGYNDGIRYLDLVRRFIKNKEDEVR